MADATKVRVGYSGAVWIGEVGATAPANTVAVPDADDWSGLGLILDEGLTEGTSQDFNEIYAWGVDAPVRRQRTSKVTTFSCRFIETTPIILSTFYDVPLADMDATAAATGPSAHPEFISFTEGLSGAPAEFALLIDVVDDDHRYRFVCPRVQVTERGDINYNKTDPVGFEMTFTALLAADNTSILRMVDKLTLPA